MKIWIGIDPGQTGAMAIISDDGMLDVFDFESGEALSTLKEIGDAVENSVYEALAVIEKASAMPKQGVSSIFKFGTNYGTWIGRLEAVGIPFDFVTPQKWKKAMFDSMVQKGADPKEMSRNRALRVFPQMAHKLARKKDHNRAEALLLAEYARRMDKDA